MVEELLREVWVVDLSLEALKGELVGLFPEVLKEELEGHDLVGQEERLGLLLVRELSVRGLLVLVLLAQEAWVAVVLVQQSKG